MSITSISPIDGRYARVTKPLEGVLSEFALMKYRFYVELEWLRFLSRADLEGIRTLSEAEHALLEQISAEFSVTDAERIKRSSAPRATMSKLWSTSSASA